MKGREGKGRERREGKGKKGKNGREGKNSIARFYHVSKEIFFIIIVFSPCRFLLARPHQQPYPRNLLRITEGRFVLRFEYGRFAGRRILW